MEWVLVYFSTMDIAKTKANVRNEFPVFRFSDYNAVRGQN